MTLEQAGDTTVVRCACGLVFVTPEPSRERLRQAYTEEYYSPWEGQAQARSRIWRGRLDSIAGRVTPPGKLLDVGCGTGDFLDLARQQGWEVTGTEYSEYAAARGQARGLRIAQGEVWEARFGGDTFDLVTCWHVIEHVTDPRQVVREMYRVLRPGGWLFLATPNVNDHIFRSAYMMVKGRRPQLYEPHERELHLFHFSKNTLRSLVQSARFEVRDVGFDRHAASVLGKRLVDRLAYIWFRCTGLHWGMALELSAQKRAARQGVIQ